MVRRGDPTAGERFPDPATLPTKFPEGEGSKEHVIVPLFRSSTRYPTLHPDFALTLKVKLVASEGPRSPCDLGQCDL